MEGWGIAIKRFAVFEGGAFSYQYGSWSAAMDSAKKRNTNKQIFMITDGKPSCVREKMEAII
jgi:hypothetical protein